MARARPAPPPGMSPSLLCAAPKCGWPGMLWPNRHTDARYCARHAPGRAACGMCGSVERWRDLAGTLLCARCHPPASLAEQIATYAAAASGDTKQTLRDLGAAVEQADRDLGRAQREQTTTISARGIDPRRGQSREQAAEAASGEAELVLSQARHRVMLLQRAHAELRRQASRAIARHHPPDRSMLIAKVQRGG